MTFSVNDMMASINGRNGLAKSSKFMAYFRQIPAGIATDGEKRDLSFLCDAVQVPGMAFQSDDIRNAGYGNIEKRPYATIFNDITLNFFCDNDGVVVDFMHRWLQAVNNFNDKSAPDSRSNQGLPPNTFAYPKDYFGTIDLVHYFDEDEDKQEVFNITIQEAYPIGMQDITLDWNATDTLTKVAVTFTYTYWTSTALDMGKIDDESRARMNSLSSNQTRIDSGLMSVRQAVKITDSILRSVGPGAFDI